ncbi:MFS general substrate transporter [Cantharellus anzutake]|uniref:MFS general substrate transporter n=1 Tax=Cantharellus anzutake TaxID=1750568 RepID=UPI001903D76B|nr:MFS general substrate transporter [Cantharellus anzutake]KAF8334316.1 MFS general substrate transporter [Cantharellus anzutake]
MSVHNNYTYSPPITTQPAEQQHMEEEREPRGFRKFWSRWGLLIKLMLALLFPILLETLDYTVVASAQPQIASSFNRLNLQSWVGTSYVITSTSFLPVFANITNIFGRYGTIQFALIVFAIGSILSTAAQSMPMLLAGRGISGVGAAALLTVTRVIFADNRNLQTNAIQTTMLSLLFAVGYSIGPLIGGFLASVSFRWIFAINLPICAASLILCFLFVRNELRGPQHDPRDDLPGRARPNRYRFLVRLSKVDWIGSFICVSALILVLLGLNWGSTREWNQAKVIAALVIGGILFLVFLTWEFYLGRYEITLNADGTIRAPFNPDSSTADGEGVLPKEPPRLIFHTVRMLPLYIFKTYNVSTISIASFAGGMLLFGCLYFIAIYFNIAAGYSSTRSGAQLLYFTPGLGTGFYIAMVIIRRFKQPKYAVVIGQHLQPIGIGLLAMAMSNNSKPQISGFLAVCGISVGMTIGTAEMVARFALADQHTAISVTINLFFLLAGGTIGLAQQSAVLETKVRSYISNLLITHQISSSDALAIARSLGSIGRADEGGIDHLPSELKSFVQDAYRYGTKWAFYSIIPWLIVGALPCLFLDTIPLSGVTEGNSTIEKRREDHPRGTTHE